MTQTYQIRVRGHLSHEWSEWLNGLEIEHQPNGETILSGPVADQAALHGLLTKIRDLGLPLLSVLLVEPGLPGGEAGHGMEPGEADRPSEG